MARIVACAVAIFFALAISGESSTRAASRAGDELGYIEVAADAETKAAPDRAFLDFGVVTRAQTAAAAAEQNSVRMQAVLDALRAGFGPDARIETGTYSVRPEYAPGRDGGAPRLSGYVAANVARLESSELGRLGDGIDAAIEAGANQVQRIAFGLSDPDAARRSALKQAVSKARAEAEAIAQALGVALGPVLSVSDQQSAPVRPFVQEAVMARAHGTPSTPIEPGLVSVRARVVLRVRIAR